MLDFIQNVVDGIMVGASYALLGLGFTLVFGVMRRLNLSYGPTLTMGVYAGAWISLQIHESLLLALCVSVLVSVIVGLLIEGICFKAVRSDNPLTSMVSAFAMWMVLEETIILLTWGRLFPVENPTGLATFDIGGFMVRGDYFILFVSAVMLMGLIWWLIYKTGYGRAVRAIATNRKAAQLMGINVPRMSSMVFILTSAFGGLVAFFIAASLHQITPWFRPLGDGQGADRDDPRRDRIDSRSNHRRASAGGDRAPGALVPRRRLPGSRRVPGAVRLPGRAPERHPGCGRGAGVVPTR